MSLRALFSAVLGSALTVSVTAAPQISRMAVLGGNFTVPLDPSPQNFDQRNPFWAEFGIRIHQKITLSSAGVRPFYYLTSALPPLYETTNIGAVINSDSQACLIIPERHYAAESTSAATRAMLLQLCRALQDHGITPILADPLPATPGQNEAQATWSLATRQIVAEIAAADSSIVTVPWYATLDPDGDGYADPSCFNDFGRPNREGLSRLAQAAASKLDYYAYPRSIYSGLDSLSPNPLMQPRSSGVPGVPGSLPVAWNYEVASSPQLPIPGVVSSIVRRAPAAPGFWWQLAVSGGEDREITLRCDDLHLPAGVPVELLADYETGPDITPDFTITPSVTDFISIPVTPPVPENTTVPVTSGTLRSMPFTTAVSMTGVPNATLTFRVHGAGTFRLGNVNLHRLDQTVPGPYRDDLDAALHGVHTGDPYRDRSAVIHRNAGTQRIHSIALWGDSLANAASSYDYRAALPNGSVSTTPTGSILYHLRPGIDRADRYAVVHQNPGGTGPLSVSLDDSLLTVTLARTGGVVTSTASDIRTAVTQAYGNTFAVSLTGSASSPASAQEQPVFFAPDSSYTGNNAFTWLQAITGQAFELDRRLHFTPAPGTIPSPRSADPAGDWDYGYDYATAADLAAGPAADILTSTADLIVGCAGAYDRQTSEPETVCNHISLLWDILLTADRPFVWMEVPPLPFGNPELVTRTNELLRQAAADRGVVLLRWDPALSGPTVWGTGFIPTGAACFRQAQFMQAFFTPLLDSAPLYDLTPASWITANPAVTVDAKSGTAPGWLAVSADSSRIQTGSSEIDGLASREQVRITPLSGGSDPGASLTTLPASTGWKEGDIVEGVADLHVIESSQLQGVSLTVLFHGTGGLLSTLASTDTISPPAGLPFRGVLRTPAAAIPHGTTAISMLVTVRGGATYWLQNAGVRRLLPPGTNPFAPPAPSAASQPLTRYGLAALTRTTHYTGSIYAYQGDDTEPSTRARGGFDSFTLGKNGTYSGRGRIDGVTFTFKGQLDSTGYSSALVTLPATLTGGAPATLTLYYAGGDTDATFRITGTLAGITGDRPLSIDLVQSGSIPTASYPAGLYTAVIPAQPGELPATGPQGHGVATFSVTSKGALRCQYVLPDGTLGTRSATLSGTGVWQFYFPAGGSAAARGGLLAGHLNFRTLDDPENPGGTPLSDLDGVISWKVPADPKSPLFPAGFDTQRTFLGWKYQIPGKTASALPGVTGSHNNVTYSFNDMVSEVVDWSSADTIKSTDLNARVNRRTGLLTGTGTDPVTRAKVRVYAVVLQNSDPVADGFFKSTATRAPAPGTTTNGPVNFRRHSVRPPGIGGGRGSGGR